MFCTTYLPTYAFMFIEQHLLSMLMMMMMILARMWCSKYYTYRMYSRICAVVLFYIKYLLIECALLQRLAQCLHCTAHTHMIAYNMCLAACNEYMRLFCMCIILLLCLVIDAMCTWGEETHHHTHTHGQWHLYSDSLYVIIWFSFFSMRWRFTQFLLYIFYRNMFANMQI